MTAETILPFFTYFLTDLKRSKLLILLYVLCLLRHNFRLGRSTDDDFFYLRADAFPVSSRSRFFFVKILHYGSKNSSNVTYFNLLRNILLNSIEYLNKSRTSESFFFYIIYY